MLGKGSLFSLLKFLRNIQTSSEVEVEVEVHRNACKVFNIL